MGTPLSQGWQQLQGLKRDRLWLGPTMGGSQPHSHSYSLPVFSFSPGRHLLQSSPPSLRLSFFMSHHLYLCTRVLGDCRDLGDRATVGRDLQGVTVLQWMVPFRSQSSRMKIHWSDMPLGEMTQQEEDMQPVGTSHAQSTCLAMGAALNTPRTHPKPCARTGQSIRPRTGW